MSEVELRLTADATSAIREVRTFSREYQEMVRALEKPMRQVGIARDLERDLEATGKAVRDTKDQLRALQAELIKSEHPSERLKTQYRETTRELNRLERAEARQQASLSRMRAELTAAGIDTSRLAQEQRRLNDALNDGRASGRKDAAVSGIRAKAAALQQQAVAQRQANMEAARENLGVNRYRAAQAEIGNLRRQYQLLRSTGRLTTQELAIAQRTMTARVRETQQALREMNAEQRRGAGKLSGVGALAALYGASRGLRGITTVADQWAEINDRIRLASQSQAEHEQGMVRLREISDRTYTDMKNNAELYIGSLSVLRERGFSNEDALGFTEAVGLGLVASAAKGERAASVINQLNQALQQGELRGDAFNSVIRNTPALADALARGLGKTREQLAGMAEDGKLTTDVWVPALIGQVDSLGAAVDGMQVTVGDALTRLNNAWEEALGSADTKPLISAIEGLTKVISDPEVMNNLVALASALVTLAATAAEGGSEFVDLGQRIGFIAANASGAVTELDRIDQQIKDIDRSIAGTGLNRTLAGLWYSKDELQAQRKALVALRNLLVTEGSGINAEQRALDEQRTSEAKQAQEKQLADYRTYANELEKVRQQVVKGAEAAGKKLLQAEKKANEDLNKLGAERVQIQKRYQQALANLGGAAGEASYGGAQALKVGAKAALDSGDVEGAKAQAQAALKMLQDLAAAGENTYGFEGFIRELEAIEIAATAIEEQAIKDKLTGIRVSMAVLADDAKKLENMPVSVEMDEASMAAARTAIDGLAAQLGSKLKIPVVVTAPVAAGAPAEGDEGFARGGYTGPGGKYQPAGIVHAGEHVQPQEVVREPGALSFLERIRRNGFNATMRGFRGYADGGMVMARAMPSIPDVPQSMLQPPAPGRDLGRVELALPGGEKLSLLADGENFDRIVRRTAMKRGRTRVN